MRIKIAPSLALILVFFGLGCKKEIELEKVYGSETLQVNKIAEHSYVHVSYLDTERFGKVPCNGAIFIDEGEALVFETPVDHAVSNELIQLIQEELGAKIGAVVVSHYHNDAMGGLDAFHKVGIVSFANQETIAIVDSLGGEVPQYGIGSSYQHFFGNQRLISLYVGEGHTTDNIVGYFPTDKVLFGGCLIKELGAGPGNLADANPEAWPQTVKDLKVLTPRAEIIIPGHGKVGDQELLDYTIDLFEGDKE